MGWIEDNELRPEVQELVDRSVIGPHAASNAT